MEDAGKPTDITPALLQHLPSHLVGTESVAMATQATSMLLFAALTSQSHRCHRVSVLTRKEKLGEEAQSEK